MPVSATGGSVFRCGDIRRRPSDMGSPGACWTLSTCEHADFGGRCPSDGAVCSLSDVLEAGSVPPRYFLTPRACAGILRRAAKRGKALPAPLAEALRGTGDTSISVVSNTDDAASDEPHRPQSLTTLTLVSKPGGSLASPAPSSQPGPSRPEKRPKALHIGTSRPQGPSPPARSGPRAPHHSRIRTPPVSAPSAPSALRPSRTLSAGGC